MIRCYTCYFDPALPLGVYAPSPEAAARIAARALHKPAGEIIVRYVKTIVEFRCGNSGSQPAGDRV